MICKSCGAVVGDFDNNCSQCGAPVIRDNIPVEPVVEQPVVEQPVVEQPVYSQNDYQQPTYPQNDYQQQPYQQPYQQTNYQPVNNYQPTNMPPQATQADPGKGLGIASMVLGIVGFVLCCCPFLSFIGFLAPICMIVGLILGFIAKSKSKSVGAKNSPALAGIILSIVPLALTIISAVIILVFGSAILGTLIEYLEAMGMGELTYMLEDILGEFGMYY